MKVKHWHVYGAGFGTGLLLMSYRVWIAVAIAFLAGALATLLVQRTSRMAAWVKDMLAEMDRARREKQSLRLAALRREVGNKRAGFPRGY